MLMRVRGIAGNLRRLNRRSVLSIAGMFGLIGIATLFISSAATSGNIGIAAVDGLLSGNAKTWSEVGTANNYVRLNEPIPTTPELTNPIGFVDSCTVVDAYYTLLRGWAYDPQSPTGDKPSVTIQLSDGRTFTADTTVAGYRDAAVNAAITQRSAQSPIGNTYGFEVRLPFLNPIDTYSIAGTVINVGAGSDQLIGINTYGPVDGDASQPYFGGGTIPSGCLPNPLAQACQAPTIFPTTYGFNGHMNAIYWNYNKPAGLGSVTYEMQVHENYATDSHLYFQAYDGRLDNSGSTNFNGLTGNYIYFGVQTNGRIIFSLFGTVDTNNVRPSPGAYAVFGTNEGPFISLRMDMPSLPGGIYRLRLTYTEFDGVGDWYSYYVTVPGGGEQSVGSIRLPRIDTSKPVYLPDNGSSWTEFWDNNNPNGLLPVPAYNVSVKFVNAVSADGQNVQPKSVSGGYFTMPNADNEVLSFNPAWIRMRGGGNTPRCHSAGTIQLGP